MRFFIALLIVLFLLSWYMFGIDKVIFHVFTERWYMTVPLIIMIIAYVIISRDINSYAVRNTHDRNIDMD